MSYNGTLQTHNNTLQEILTKIDELPTKEITPDGTLTITNNGEHDVTYYEKADVQVSRRIGAFNVAVGQDLSGFVWLIDTSTLWDEFRAQFGIPITLSSIIRLVTFSNGSYIWLHGNGTYYITSFEFRNYDIMNNGVQKDLFLGFNFSTNTPSGSSVGHWSCVSNSAARSNIIGYRFPEGTTITYVNPDYDVQGMIDYLYQHSPY